MPSVISSGIGSGLDIAGIVQQLVAAEGQPVEARIARQEARTQAQLSAFGSLQSALAEFRDKLEIMQDLQSFLTRKAVSADEEIFTVSADSSAVPARYSVEVAQLAQAQKLTSGAFATADTVVGTGTLTIAVGAGSFEVEITAENNSLAGIRDAINNAGDNAGVAATIVNAEAGSYLILTAEDTGSDQAMTVTQAGGDGGLSTLTYDPSNGLNALTEAAAARDAQIFIDGFEVLSSSNTISGAIDGITLDLLQASAGAAIDLHVDNDEDAVRQTITEFVDAWNHLTETIDSLTAYDPTSELAGPLLGDATVRGVQSKIRRELSAAVESVDLPFSMLSDIGIETEVDGKLSVDDAKLSAALSTDFQRLGQLFANPTDGFATRMFDVANGFLDTDGALETRTSGLNARIDSYGEQREKLNDRLVALEARLFRQFNALDALLGQLSATSNYLTQQLANLPTVGDSRDRD
ncbi:MAG: flagellar filament capping protein FliD [Woeseiaceae bacterium]